MRKKPIQSTPVVRRGLARYTPLNNEAELRKAIAGDAPSKPVSKIELSQWLQVTTRFLENEVHDGRLRAVRLGRRGVRFLPSDVSKWLNARPTLQSDQVAAA